MSVTTSTSARPDRLTSTAKRRRARRARRRWSGLAFVAPALAMYGVFTLLPALHTIYLSLFEWDGVGAATFAGLANYVEVFGDETLRASILHSLLLIVFFSLIPVTIGLALVGLLARRPVRGMTFYRVIFFLPYVLPLVAVGITWRWMYSLDGVVNQLVGAVGLDGLTRAWLGDFTLALPAIGLIGTWTLTGFCMMLLLSGAQKIDPALYEAARIDGAGALREFRHITLPALRPEISLALIVTTIAALASFDLVYVTTNGAPADRTTVPGLLVYRLAFNDGQVGQACALAVVLTVLVLIVVVAIRRLTRPEPDA